MITISLEQLLELHVLTIADSGGSDGLRDLGRLEAAIATQTLSVFGSELFESLFEKAAALVGGIIGDHAFVNGNKRTSMLVGITFLITNQQNFKAKKGEIEDFAVRIATDHLEIADIAAWLEAHAT